MSTRIGPPVTVADLDATPEDGNRYELIEGELYVSRAPGIVHQLVVHNLQLAFGGYLVANPIGVVVPSTGVVFSDVDAVIPDLVYVSRERWGTVESGGRFVGAPDLAIEVLSPGKANEDRDRIVKRQLYAKWGVAEYWIVDPDRRAIEIFRLGESGLEPAAEFHAGDEASTPLLPGFRLPVASAFALNLP